MNLASSLSSFFDYTGITNLAQSRIASKIHEMILVFLLPCLDDLSISNRLPVTSNRTTSASVNNVISSFVCFVVLHIDFSSLILLQLKSKKNHPSIGI